MLSQKILSFSLLGAEWVLWVLVALSFVSLAVVFDRIVLFMRTREDLRLLEPSFMRALSDGNLDVARKLTAQDGFVRNVLRAGLDAIAGGRVDASSVEQAMLGAMAVERNRHETRLSVLGTIGNNAPFVGLFGTVLGIILAFNQLGQSNVAQAAQSSAIMTSISEALVATGVGIAVAIPAVAAYNFAKSAIAARSKNAEALMRAMMAGSSHFDRLAPRAEG